jgi:putative transposase
LPRKARVTADTNIYHAVIRGINHQQIFEDTEDYERFLSVLERYRNECGFLIIAYCLMGNHVHLLIRTGNTGLDKIFKKIGVSYVMWFNRKYGRSGHLLYDRFRSEPVTDLYYLSAAVNYIHNNPVKAGLVSSADEYRYSSFRDYFTDIGYGISDCDFLSGLINIELISLKKEKEGSEDHDFIDIEKRCPKGDIEARKIIYSVCGCSNVTEFQVLTEFCKKKYIRLISNAGLNTAQISRLTGVTYYFAQKYSFN